MWAGLAYRLLYSLLMWVAIIVLVIVSPRRSGGEMVAVATWAIVTTIITVYCVLCIGIGYVADRRFRKIIEDFFVLIRTAGFIVVFISIASTYHSAFTFLTSVAVFASAGISFWIAAMTRTTLATIWELHHIIRGHSYWVRLRVS